MQTKFDVGQRVRICTPGHSSEGQTHVVQKIEIDKDRILYGVVCDDCRIWCTEEELQAVPVPQPGDKVRVTLEGIVNSVGKDDAYVVVGSKHYVYAKLQDCEVIE